MKQTKELNLKSFTTIDAHKTFFNFYVVYLIFSLLLFVISTIVSESTGVAFENLQDIKAFEIFTILLSPLMFFTLFIWQSKRHRGSICANIGINKRIDYKYIILAVASAVFCIVFFAPITTLFDNILSIIGFNPSDEIVMNGVGDLLLNILLLAILPAVLEELIFRGIIFSGLKDKHSAFNTILVSSTFFMLMHGTLQQTVFQFIIGIVLGLIMYYTDNVLYPIIMHFVSNLIILLAAFFSTSSVPIDVSFNFLNVFLPIVLALIGVAIIFLVCKFLNKKKQPWTNNLTFKNYTFSEKKYAICSVLISVILWVVRTAEVFV